MFVTVVAIDLTYVDLECLSGTWFCCFVLEFFHFVLEMPWKFFVKSVLTLCICGKIFECLIYNIIYDFCSENNLSLNQSGFRLGDSCINQLLSINHEISNAFDKILEIRGIFLDISKAFDKV